MNLYDVLWHSMNHEYEGKGEGETRTGIDLLEKKPR